MAVMPSDHVISPDADFQDANRIGRSSWSKSRRGRIVTFGIRPTYPGRIVWLYRAWRSGELEAATAAPLGGWRHAGV